jgi:predicted O-linked N-acetylglucosamine transferase (SPINDLY family)
VVLYNGGAADKIVPLQLDAWLRAMARIPGSYLVLAPFNPGWSGTRAAVNLFGLLEQGCREHGVDRRRVIVLRELSPHDTAQLAAMSTVYLGTFPHGSSTSVALAMQALLPTVTRQSPWLRGTGDASIVESIGLTELVAPDADGYVELTVRLATDRAFHASVVERIRAALPTAPFLASREYGEALQRMFDHLSHETAA